MSPQVSTAWVRGLVITLVVAAASGGEYACAHLLTGDATKSVVVGAIGTACNIILARVGEGKVDANRAAMLRRQLNRGEPVTALRQSDVGYAYVARPKVR